MTSLLDQKSPNTDPSPLSLKPKLSIGSKFPGKQVSRQNCPILLILSDLFISYSPVDSAINCSSTRPNASSSRPYSAQSPSRCAFSAAA